MIVDRVTGEVLDSLPKIRHPLCARYRVTADFVGEESMTQQSHMDASDINKIVDRFRRTGQMPIGDRQPVYADVTALQVDLTEAYNRAVDVEARARGYFDDQAKAAANAASGSGVSNVVAPGSGVGATASQTVPGASVVAPP